MLCFFLTQFVAQPNCQQLLATLWYDGFPGWRRRHWVVKLITCFTIGLLFPVFSTIYLLAPKSTLGLFIKKPFIKFICHTASYLTFLFLLLLASQHIVQTDLHVQGPPPTIVEWMILPWVLGKHTCWFNNACLCTLIMYISYVRVFFESNIIAQCQCLNACKRGRNRNTPTMYIESIPLNVPLLL